MRSRHFSQVIRESRFGCPRIARVISSEELGTMSKNNLGGITLVRGPVWGIHSFTLIISWSQSRLCDQLENLFQFSITCK